MIADGKRRYETTPESLDSIALDFSSNRSTLRNVAKRENWKRYVPPPRGLSRAAEIAGKAAALEAEALAALSSPSPESGMSPSEEAAAPPTAPGKAWSMRERIDELRAAVDEEIAAVRALRAKLKSVPHGTEAAGRTSRTLADLTTTLERLRRLEIGAPQHERQDTHDDMPADLDAFREDLARQIEAFMESRPDEDDAQDDSAAQIDAAP
ncbi:MAG TPA: hypothetical protein VK522_15540 [Pseudolabrys sp.]|nr:hypothetical protein [Pseudolabrys sp.]